LNYAWRFEKDALSVIPAQEERENVVYRVKYRLAAIDGIHQAFHRSECTLSAPGSKFIEYEDITPEVLGKWIEDSSPEIENIKTELATEVEKLKSEPFTITPGLPWEGRYD
jgi:hypothetical protein